MRRALSKRTYAAYARNFVFGVEDSLVSSVGLLSGIATANVERGTIVITGLVLIFVEAFSMGIGSFLAEESADEYENKLSGEFRRSSIGAFIMFISYVVAGILPLGPYLLFPSAIALPVSIISSLIGLAVVGMVSAAVFKISYLKQTLRILILGGLAIVVGIVVGNLASAL